VGSFHVTRERRQNTGARSSPRWLFHVTRERRIRHSQCGEGVGLPHGVSGSLWAGHLQLGRTTAQCVGGTWKDGVVDDRARAGRFTLDTKLSGILGGRSAQALHRAFGYETAGDLLAHYPRRYAMRGELTALETLPLDESVTIIAEVLEVRERSMRARRGTILEVKISDGTGTLLLTFFNQAWRAAELSPGVRGIFAGRVSVYQGARQLAHPDYQLFTDADASAARGEPTAEMKRWAETPIPIYPSTASIASWQIQKMVELVLDGLVEVADPLPPAGRVARSLVSHRAALDSIHRPETQADPALARRTLRFTEAFVLQTALLQRRAALREQSTVARHPQAGGYLDRFDAALPFQLTADQQRVATEIATDLASDIPMSRLVQGEVGSGKTVVALRAMLAVADSGGQSVLLAPTEVLAAQHLRSIARMLGPNLAVSLLPTLITGQLPAAERKRALLRAAAGQTHLIVGTHALLSDRVMFADLGLIVVDEQHRFGVEQREALRVKGQSPPHVLVLTATPIPRTVAMTVFGDLDISTIAELPADRATITSQVVPLAIRPAWRDRIWHRLAEEVQQGRQAFVVCPAIDQKTGEPGELTLGDSAEGVAASDPSASSSAREAAARAAPEGTARSEVARKNGTRTHTAPESTATMATVSAMMAELAEHPALSSVRIAALHGRLSADEKDRVMRAFAAGDIDVLVATTVIEVGVDVPNASVMVVLDADRFGVSQLHQLRGRVGRGEVPGLCLLVTTAGPGSVGLERVEAVAATLDGFELARVDLELRREGDVLGAAQSGGRSSLRLLRVAHHGDIIADARELAQQIVEVDPQLREHPTLADAVRRRLNDEASEFLGKG